MSSADTSLHRHATAESVFILKVIASSVCFDVLPSDRCQEDYRTPSLPKITLLCERMCEKYHRLSSDVQLMYEHSTVLLLDVHLHAREGRLSRPVMV